MRNNQVKLLQEYLSKDKDIYPGGVTSGYYGTLTKEAVERFQKKHNIVSSGSPYTTGYGLAGPITRAKIVEILGTTLAPQKSITIVHTPQTQTTNKTRQVAIASIQTQINKLQELLVSLLSQLVEVMKAQLGR